jgi:hypothetical protein
MLEESIFNLKGFNWIFDSTISNEIADNLVNFFDWGLLNKGNFINVDLDNSNSILTKSNNPNFEDGTAWSGNTFNWIWQSGVSFNNTNPIQISGIYIDNTFTPLNSGYYINYENGMVVFNEAISDDSEVKLEYSHRYINVDYADSNYSKTLDDALDFKDKIVKLPLIAVEPIIDRKHIGYQLGGGQTLKTKVLFHCVAENDPTRNMLLDIVSYQNDKSIYFYDSNKIRNNNDFPIDYRGVPVSGALNYRELVTQHTGYLVRFSDVTAVKNKAQNTSIYTGVVSFTLELTKTRI